MGELSALTAALIWALTSVGIRFGAVWIDVFWLNAFRCLGGSILVCVVASIVAGGPGVLVTIPLAAVAWLMVSTLFGNAIGDSAYFRATQLIGVSRALPIANAFPLLTLGAAAAFLGEPVTPGLVVGTLLVIAGVYLVAKPAGKTLPEVKAVPPATLRRGVVLAGVAACCWATSSSLLKLALNAGEVNVLVANGVRLAFSGLILVTFAHQARRPLNWQKLGWRFVLAPALLSLSGLSSPTFFLLGVSLAGVAKASALQATAPLFALPLSILLLDERLTKRIALGSVLSIVGIWLLFS